MLFLGRWVRSNPLLFSLPSPALEVSRPIVHFLGFTASPKIPTFRVFPNATFDRDVVSIAAGYVETSFVVRDNTLSGSAVTLPLPAWERFFFLRLPIGQ